MHLANPSVKLSYTTLNTITTNPQHGHKYVRYQLRKILRLKQQG